MVRPKDNLANLRELAEKRDIAKRELLYRIRLLALKRSKD